MPELGERVRIFTLTGQTGHGENRLPDNGTRPRTYSTEAMAAPRRKALKTARALITEGGYSLSPCGRSAPGRTLYNIFESRDNLIMAAINYHFSASEIDTEYMTPPAPV